MRARSSPEPADRKPAGRPSTSATARQMSVDRDRWPRPISAYSCPGSPRIFSTVSSSSDRAERLHEVGVHAERGGAVAIGVLRAGGQHDHGHVAQRPDRVQRLDHLDTALARHHPVEDQEVGTLGECERAASSPVARLDQAIVGTRERRS
jgi:hypothetical protein